MKFSAKIVFALNILMLILFLPVLFCVIFIGNGMDYNVQMKLTVLLPGFLMVFIALIGVAVWMFIFSKCRERQLETKENLIANILFLASYILLFLVNIRVAKEIAFKIPWDISVVRAFANEYACGRQLGYQYYLSMYSNNIPITYILGKILRKAMEWENYPYVTEFIWIQVNCALLSLGGYFCCLTVKKLTGKILPSVLAFCMYLVLVGISPWKIAPYTDTYGLVFPIACIYFYVCYKSCKNNIMKYLCLAVSFLAGMTGGLIKPSVYIMPIAILCIELTDLISEHKAKWKYVLFEILLATVLLFGNKLSKEHMIQEMRFDFNEEIEASWHHYFYMGLNEEATGGYNSDDVTMFGEFQTSKSDRNKAEIERAAARLKDRGLGGTLYFWLRKMVMTFNDGTFGWRSEVWIGDYYLPELADNTEMTQKLRDIFWPNASNMGGYNTLCQLAWIFCLLGIPGICVCNEENRKKYAVPVVSFIGFFLYQMLFEARARYLLVCLPLLIAVSACGIQQYAIKVREKAKRGNRIGRSKKDTTPKESC